MRTDHDRLMVLLVFRSPQLHKLLERFPGKSYYNVLQPELKGYWKFFGRVDLGSTWFFHAPVPPGTTAENFDFQAYLHEAVGAPFDVEIEHIGFWDLRFAIAEKYRTRRVFIAGDAAHSHPPYGGYGVNSGLEDARNLGWKLAAFLQGWGGEPLLESYDVERRPVFESTARDFIARSIETDSKFLSTFDPGRDREAFEAAWQARAHEAIGEVNAFEPNYEGSTVIAGAASPNAKPSAKGSHMHAARAGHHLSPVTLPDGRNVFDALGTGFSVLAFGASSAAANRFCSVAQSLQLPLAVSEQGAETSDARLDARWVLIRPDHFIAWVSHDEEPTVDAIRHALTVASGRG